MNCLILAAGHGSRLREVSASKPLTPLAGRPLIAHVIDAAMAAGATTSTIVTGHEAARVEAFLAGLDVPVDCVRLDDWDRPNGHSVVAGATKIDGDYLLLMSDHLFDPEIARRTVASGRASGAALTLAVDRDWRRDSLDLDDATKVALDGDRIVAIGKTLDRFDAVDTGIFHATPALAIAIRDAIALGKAGSLSDGVQRLAVAGQAQVADATGLFWLDVDDPIALAKAEAHFATGSAA
ncbi:phosphocholine cytidylyltransferase family protein [Sphingosinicella sp.]|uniref:phosphocholine cytidylyltransferase family protein n=1 Tax=Sphingosinicella sp. TaxID=1917971 RepID=UPI0040382E03